MQTIRSRRHSACYPSLKGKVIFITGGGSGIGAALVQRFSWQGAKVAFVDIEKALSEAVVTSLSEHVHPPVFIECDIRDIAALQMAIERVGRDLGEVSVLVNNAANDTRHKIEDVTVEYWDNRMAINQRPMFFAAQAVIPQMQRLGGGSIINFGSVSTRIGSNFPAYMTAKAGAHGLTKGLARDTRSFQYPGQHACSGMGDDGKTEARTPHARGGSSYRRAAGNSHAHPARRYRGNGIVFGC